MGKRGGLAVMLIFARTDTKAFHEYIYHKAEIRFLKGRVKFGGCKKCGTVPVYDRYFWESLIYRRNRQWNLNQNIK